MTGKPIKPAALLILGVIVTLPSSGEALNPGDTDQGTPHAPGQQAPSNETDPSISGNAIAGETLSASVGEWSGPNVMYAFQWQRCDAGGGACGPAGPGDESFRLDQAGVRSPTRRSGAAASNGQPRPE